MTESKREHIKAHFAENKKAYISGGICLVVGAASTVLLKGIGVDSSTVVSPRIAQVLSWKPTATQTVVIEMVERSTPSRPVHLVGTNLYFNSLSEAARQTGHSISRISQNVNGHIDNVKGDVFELLEKA